MPIIENDPWRQQYFHDVACPDDGVIMTDDAFAHILRSLLLNVIREIDRHAGKPCDDARHASKVELIRGIGRAMIMRIAEQGGIREHDCRIALSAKGPVVRPGNADHPSRRRHTFRGEGRMTTE